MKQIFLGIVISLLLPTSAHAAVSPASFSAAQDLVATSTVLGNAYNAGASVVITAPTTGDLSVVGGSVVAAGPVSGDTLLIGGSLSTRAPIKGDFRAIGGTVIITEPVAGDLVAIGYRVDDEGRAGGSVFVAAANASLVNGAAGPVTVYANNVLLAGEFSGDVRIVAGGSVTLSKDTVIRGKLSYEAPETARMHASTTVMGGIHYTSASYLPDAGTSRALALASIGIFLLIRVLGALILAGLLAGLFPSFAAIVADRATSGRMRDLFLITLLGFAAIVATPILLILTAVTFVGLGVAFLLTILYVLLMVLAGVYAGILLGILVIRRFTERQTVLWRDGVLGMLIFSLVALVPILGWAVALLLTAFVAGTLLSLFFRFAFPREGEFSEEI